MNCTQKAVLYVLDIVDNWFGRGEFYIYGEYLEYYDDKDIRRGSYSLKHVEMTKFFAIMEMLDIKIQ